MNNALTSLENLWIDRKTYQKVFKTLYDRRLDPTSSRLQRIIQRSVSPVVFLSGVYDKKKGEFHKSFSMAHEEGILTESHDEGDIEVLLLETIKTGDSLKDKLISKVRVPTDVNMDILYSNGGGETIKLTNVPILASLPVPKGYFTDERSGKNLKVVVQETFYREANQNNTEKPPYVQPVSFEDSKTIPKKGKILYTAPVDWEASPEDLIVRIEDKQ